MAAVCYGPNLLRWNTSFTLLFYRQYLESVLLKELIFLFNSQSEVDSDVNPALETTYMTDHRVSKQIVADISSVKKKKTFQFKNLSFKKRSF